MGDENKKIDINKHEVDIDTLKKQNVNDLLSIKQLYGKLKEIEELTSKIYNIAKISNISNDDIKEIFKIIFEEEK